MLNKVNHIIISLLLLCLNIEAQPLLSSAQIIAGQKVYRDAKLQSVYYYMPLNYVLATDTKNKPDFSFIQMRYTGTRAAGDAGAAKYNNLLQFRVITDASQEKQLAAFKVSFKSIYPSAELRILPVTKFSSVLVFAGTADSVDTSGAHLVKTSNVQAADDNAIENNSYWNERVVTLRLNNNDAQLVEAALRNHRAAMSFSYGFYTSFSEADANALHVSANKNITKEIRDFYDNEIKDKKDSALHTTLVAADAIPVNIDIDKWPLAIQKIDINEKVPAKYALFDVYCYDFNNDLRPDLYSKKIEIKATSVNGSDVITAYSFKAARPDQYAKSIRFNYAVKFDKPFYYRVTEIDNDGESTVTDWKQKTGWSEILDITSAGDKIIVKPVITDQ